MATISLDRISKWYQPGQPVVNEVSLDIRDREFMVIVGPSGCGKSTTLRMIAGLEDISDGELRIDGARMNEVAPKDRDIAMVFQNYALYPHMTVFQNMAFGLKLRKMPAPEIKRRVQEAARILGLEPYLERKPKELSGGQRQRVAVGRAIVRQPRVFLFDEPLSNLDAKMRVQTRGEIARLHHNLQATMVYVTHDQVEAMTLGTRIVVMDGGRIQQVDTPLNLYNRPKNRFVAGFIGSPAMNFIEGVLHGGPQPRFEAEGGLACEPAAAVFDKPVETGSRPAVLGIRSEHWLPCEPSDPLGALFTVEVAEPLGSETYLFGKMGRSETCIRTHGRDVPEPGSTLKFRPNPLEAHLFSTTDSTRL